MAKKNARSTEEVDGKVNLSPMIDCCFLLLIFFVVNATQITVSKDPSISMPSAVSASDLKDAKGCIVVNVFNDPDKMEDNQRKKYEKTYPAGTIWGATNEAGKTVGFNESQMQDLTDLILKQKEAFKAKGMEDNKIRLYLRGDVNTPWKRSAAVIRCAGAAGVTEIVFGTLPVK